MSNSVYTRRYSQAIFHMAQEGQDFNAWQSDLRKIASLVEDAELTALLENPKLHFDDKAKLLSERLGDINPLALNLAYLLVTRGRLGMIGGIADEYQRLSDSYRGIEQAEVTTVIPLDDEDRLRMEKRLGVAVDKKVVLKPKVDASLIGGIIARIGDKLIDGSTRNKLEALKRELKR